MRPRYSNWKGFVVVGWAALLSSPPTGASEYSCRVPRALLCDGCASHIAIALQRGGGCRVSFTPVSVVPSLNASAQSSAQLEFQVEDAPRIIVRRSAASRGRRVALARPMSRERCFIFNGRSYCE